MHFFYLTTPVMRRKPNCTERVRVGVDIFYLFSQINLSAMDSSATVNHDHLS